VRAPAGRALPTVRRPLVALRILVARRLRADWASAAPGVPSASGVPGASGASGDRGSAVVEFLGVALLLLVPTVYLVLVLGRLQAATFAVDGAAREAVRAVLAVPAWDATRTGGDPIDPQAAARAAATVALHDQGLPADPEAVDVVCDPGCSAAGAGVTARVEVRVPLPGVPAVVQGAIPLAVPVSAQASGLLDAFVVGAR
jgi:hypothetical protein